MGNQNDELRADLGLVHPPPPPKCPQPIILRRVGAHLDGQVTVLAGGGQLLDVAVHLSHRQAARALLPAAQHALQPRQHPLQLRVQVAAGVYKGEG